MVLKHISPWVAMLQELVTLEMFKEDERMSLLDMLLNGFGDSQVIK
ncbi:hypothetical protein Pint_33922 [Pistacia integerrima]|uniref:Uncharacterized protein n=1 Tax=Pistacia integerrima TaxID=434235 RepID=A0ACC0X5X0_9ROSI|nr:hypothetical protein Pint_33922 [Pistacia integerrima]